MLYPLIAIAGVLAFSATRSALVILIAGCIEFMAISGAWVASETFTIEVWILATIASACSRETKGMALRDD